jgi:D-3-phosphoglycerate dehydrogenase|tara:strand:- start:12597 stop:13544 length:948 start_codon:yes stop_codon:yes gene_type:complete
MNILFVDTVHPILSQRLTSAGLNCMHFEQETNEEIFEKLKTCDGLVIRSRFPLDENRLKMCANLKFIARSGAGMENIDVEYCAKKGIQLFNSPEGNRNAVGEHALGMLLSLMNHLHTGHQEILNGVWDREGNRGDELDGKTVGIIGYGNNGSAFAKKLRGFDVKVLAYDKYKTDFGDHFVMESTLEAIQSQADVISFHIPQNEETVYFFNEAFLNKCEKPIYLLNLSRGKIICIKDLVKGFNNDQILGAGLDVLEYEDKSFENFFESELPMDFIDLVKNKNLILSPHVGGWSGQSYLKLSDVLADKILTALHREN